MLSRKLFLYYLEVFYTAIFLCDLMQIKADRPIEDIVAEHANKSQKKSSGLLFSSSQFKTVDKVNFIVYILFHFSNKQE